MLQKQHSLNMKESCKNFFPWHQLKSHFQIKFASHNIYGLIILFEFDQRKNKTKIETYCSLLSFTILLWVVQGFLTIQPQLIGIHKKLAFRYLPEKLYPTIIIVSYQNNCILQQLLYFTIIPTIITDIYQNNRSLKQ